MPPVRILFLAAWATLSVVPTGLAAPPVSADLASALPDVAEQAVQSVVNVSTRRMPRSSRDPLRGMPFFFGPPMPQERPGMGAGSGVIVDASGLVLTNHHVVEGADVIEVTLHDGRQLEAEVVGTDPRSDVGVVRLVDPPDDLVPLAFGDSDALRLGEPVLAIGNPFGVGQTVTFGIVSAKGRANLGLVDYEDFIQTDAAINPGNSGGGLVNLRGELVGINTAMFSRSGGYQGIGFAIPSNMARRLMEDLLGDGKVDRGFLGILIQDLDPGLREALGVDVDGGALVADVNPGSAAEDAGFESGDVVLAFDGEDIASSADLRMKVADAGSDARFTAVVLREGRRVKLKGTLGALEPEEGPEERLAGLTVAPLEDAMRLEGGPPPGGEGLLVRQVRPGSSADRAGIRAGDVLLQVGQSSVASARELGEALEGEGTVAVVLWRGGRRLFLALKRS